MAARRRLPAIAVVLVASLAAACSAPSASQPPESHRTQDAAPSADRLVLALYQPPEGHSPLLYLGNISQPFVAPRNEIPRLVHSALYRYDDSLAPVPHLATDPCAVGDDQVTITCRLAEASFHDGTPVTADDVAFTYEIARRADCEFGAYTVCLDTLDTVTAVDQRTVEFRLSRPDATFLTVALPQVFIEPRAVLEDAYQPLADRAATLDPEQFTALVARIGEASASESPDCDGVMTDVDSLLQDAGMELTPRQYFQTGPEGTFDACGYIGHAGERLARLGRSLAETGVDAVATAYAALPSNWRPVGAGPWHVRGLEDARRLLLEAHADHHAGQPATPMVEVRYFEDFDQVVEQARIPEVHWVPYLAEAYDELRDDAGLAFADYETPVFFFLAFNLREGRLFADRSLRTALELCIDKPATVDAATGGAGAVIYSPIEPFSWAYRDDLPRLDRNVGEARRLIEESGWVPAEDGIYRRGERRLATEVYVRADDAVRIEFLDLVAAQALDCGMELTVVPADPGTVFNPLSEYPHIPPGEEEPVDAVFLGWAHGYDPHDILFDSRSASSEAQPDGLNFMGFSDPRIDALLDEGISTYDQRERARIYREYQTILAEERPVLFAWAVRDRDALSADLHLTDGELNLSSTFWFWQLEKLAVRGSGEAT